MAAVIALLVCASCGRSRGSSDPVPPPPTIASSVESSPATATSTAPTPPTAPVAIAPAPSAVAPLALALGDRALTITYGGGMPIPCEKRGVLGGPHGSYAVDLVRASVTFESFDACGNRARRSVALGAKTRAALVALTAALDAPNGTQRAPDAPRHTIAITRADGGVSSRNEQELEPHEGEAIAIAQLLASLFP